MERLLHAGAHGYTSPPGTPRQAQQPATPWGHTCQPVHSPGWGQGPELSAPCDVSDAPPPQFPLGLPCDSSRSTWSKSKVIEGPQSEG